MKTKALGIVLACVMSFGVHGLYAQANAQLVGNTANDKYIADYLVQVKKIKPNIPDITLQKIKQAFDLFVNKDPYGDRASVLIEVMQHLYPDTSLVAFFNKSGILHQANFLSAAERNRLIREEHVSRNGLEKIYPIIKEKTYQQVLLEYTFGTNGRLRDVFMEKSADYYDSLIAVELLKDGSLLGGNQFAIGLKYRDKIGIPETLVDSLLYHAMYLHRLQKDILEKDPFAKTDFKAYEATHLNRLLTEIQYTRLLTIKNRSQAKMNADDDWDDMEKWHIAFGLDSAATKKDLFNYYIAKLNAYYRMADDKIKQEANARALKDIQPKVLKALSAAQKLPAPANNNTALKLKW